MTLIPEEPRTLIPNSSKEPKTLIPNSSTEQMIIISKHIKGARRAGMYYDDKRVGTVPGGNFLAIGDDAKELVMGQGGIIVTSDPVPGMEPVDFSKYNPLKYAEKPEEIDAVAEAFGQKEFLSPIIRFVKNSFAEPNMHMVQMLCKRAGEDCKLCDFVGEKDELSISPNMLIGFNEETKPIARLMVSQIIDKEYKDRDRSREKKYLRFVFPDIEQIGAIPNFQFYTATIGPYNMAVLAGCRSVSQLQKLYPDEWRIILDNFAMKYIDMGEQCMVYVFGYEAFVDEKK